MVELELTVVTNARERALGEIEFAYSLIASLVGASGEFHANGLRRCDLMVESNPDTDPVRRLLDHSGEDAIDHRRAYRLVLYRCGTVDTHRQTGPVSDQRAIEVPRMLACLPGRPQARERVARVQRRVAHRHTGVV